jgi:LPS O-antigen subunit length determinant protein (WzzB/FepE family)
MKYKNHNYKNHEIDLLIILKVFWRQKIFILCFSLACLALGLFYYVFSSYIKPSQKADHEIVFFIKKMTNSNFFFEINSFFTKTEVDEFAYIFNNEFKINLENPNNLIIFFNQYTNTNFFDSNFNKVFIEKVKDPEVNINAKYKFTHANISNPMELLNEYLMFVKDLAEEDIKKEIKKSIKTRLDVLDYNFQKTLIKEKSFLEELAKNRFIIDKEFLFEGSKVLSFEIKSLTNLLKEFDQKNIDYKPFLTGYNLTSTSSVATKSAVYYGFFGMILGFFLSLFIICFNIMARDN